MPSPNKRYPSYYDASLDNEDILDCELACPTSDGLMSKEDKVKLDSINLGEGGNIIVNPEVKASNVIQDNEHRFVTDTEKDYWNNKADNILASNNANGLMSAEDKTKLDGIQPGANYYVHPDSHSASMITQDTSHRFVSDEQINKWNSGNDSSGVFNADTHYDFPSIGSVDVIYKAYKEGKTYQWNAEKLTYEPLNDNIIEIKLINGGNANAGTYD